MSEKNDYQTFLANIRRPGDRIDRIENMTGDGIPDVNYCFDGVEGWIEFKSPIEPKRESTPLFGSNHRMRQSQMNWHLRQRQAGGISYIMICTNRRWMLIDGKRADEINDSTVGELIDLADWTAQRPFSSVPWPSSWMRLREVLRCK